MTQWLAASRQDYRSLRWSAVAERKQGRAQKNAKVARRGQPHSAKICYMPEKCLAQNCNQFRKLFQYFSGMQQIFARYGVARVLQLSHFFARVLACVLRRLTTSSYLGGSLNGSHILPAFQVLKFGPPFSCNMLRARRRHAIDGEETQGPRAGEAKMKTGQNPSVKEQKHAKPNSPRLHNIKFAHICPDMKNIGFTATSEA